MYHKGMPFEDREEVLERFRNGQFPILVCGKEITRGVDLPAITHVIQYEFAGNAYDHMHRVGRTARMGNPGQATTLYTPWERPLVKAIERSRYEGLTHFHHVDRRYRLRLKEEGVSAGLCGGGGGGLCAALRRVSRPPTQSARRRRTSRPASPGVHNGVGAGMHWKGRDLRSG